MFKDAIISSNDYLEVLFEASTDAIIILNEEHKIIRSNAAFRINFPAPLSSKSINSSFNIVIGKLSYQKIFKPTIEACIEKGKRAVISKWSEYEGVRRFFQWTFIPLTAMESKPNVLAIAKDFTENQKLKEEILQKDMELKSLIQSETDFVFFVSPSLRIFDSNNLGLAFAKKKTKGNFHIGDHLLNIITEKHHALVAELITEVIEKNHVIKRQKFFKKSQKYYEFIFKPIITLTGKVAGALIMAVDITLSKTAEKEMHLSRNKLKSLFDSSIQSIFLLGNNYEVLEFNKRASDDIKKIWKKELSINDNILDYFLSAMHHRFVECFNKAIGGEKCVIEQNIDYPNGLKVWSEITFVPVYNMEEEIIGVSFSTLDITERKTVGLKLSENEANLTSLIENNDTLVWSVDRDYRLILLNSQFKAFFKNIFKADLTPGMHILECMDKHTKQYFQKQLNKVYQGISIREDYNIQLPKRKVIVELIMNPIVSGENIIGASVFFMDITDRKHREIELEELNNSYRQEIEIRKKIEEDLKFKNNELDTFIYKASHDLRGPIASLMGLYNAAIIDIKDRTSLEYLEYINKTAQRMDQVLKALINLSEIKDRPLNLELTYLKQLIKDAIDILEIKDGIKNATFKVEVPEISFYTDAGLLMVIIKNLLENAMRHSRLTVNCVIKVKAEIMANKEIRLNISDNGLGMNPEIQDKVFNMFYKGNNLSSGSGLGLYMVKSAAYKLGGKVSLKSVVNKGTIFQISLPEIAPRI